MKIGIITNTFPPVTNGVSVAVESLKRELERHGHKVFVVCPAIDDLQNPSEEIFYIRSTKIPENISPDLKVPFFFIQQATQFFQKHQIDILHSHDTIMGGPETSMIALNLKIPAVHTFHTHIETYNYFPFPGYKVFIRNYVREVLNNYQHVIVPSQKMYNYLLDLGVKVPISRVLNIPNLETLKLPKNPQVKQKLKQLGIHKGDFVFLSFCRLAIEKGVENSIHLLQPLLTRNPKAKLLIAGWGPDGERLKQIVKELGIDEQVIFYGKYDRSELSALADQAKVFVFTSYSDNLPTNIFEAMYFGLPVLSVEDMSVDYLLKNGVNGYKAEGKEFTNKAEEMLANPELLSNLSKAALESALQIDPFSIVNEHIHIYEYCLENYRATDYNDSRLTEISNKSLQILNGGYKQLQKYYTGITSNFGFPFR